MHGSNACSDLRRPARSRRATLLSLAAVAMVGLFGAAVSSCGGDANSPSDLVLVSFNQPDVAGVPLNQPLIFTFSADVDPGTITPDTLRIVGQTGPFFDSIVVDGNLVGLNPRSPNFDDYRDAGFARSTTYTVSMSVFPAASTIRSTAGRPLLAAQSYQFTTLPSFTFIEPRRPISHGLPPPGGRSDDLGCLQNGNNSLFVPPMGEVQFGSLPGARLFCEINQGQPRVILDQCVPTHDSLAVGTPSAVSPGYIDLPAMRIRVNEPVDPNTVTPVTSADLGVNVQLWRVGDTQKNALPGNPEPIEISAPQTVQNAASQEIILVASKEVLQGTYLINLRPTVTDLPGLQLRIDDRPSPVIGGYAAIDAGLAGKVPPGYRMYFVTLELPNTAQALNESFGSNLNEYGDINSGGLESGVVTMTVPTTNSGEFVGGGPVPPSPNVTLDNTVLGCGQSTTANWNNGFRFLNLPNIDANADVDGGVGRLKAVWKPYAGGGGDGAIDTNLAPYSAGADTISLTTDQVPGASVDNDGIYEFESFHLAANDILSVSGSNPLVIFCRGDFILEGTLSVAGSPGAGGVDTDGTAPYTNAGHGDGAGRGGAGGPGGGVGGHGGDPFVVLSPSGIGQPGRPGRRFEVDGSTAETFAQEAGAGGGGATGVDATNAGGGGGGFGAVGSPGANASAASAANGGPVRGDATFERLLTEFRPDRGYVASCDIRCGSGGGGGALDDDGAGTETGDGLVANNDDAGAGGGGGGGGIIVFAGGNVIITGTINADGGAGGSTFNKANTNFAPGADGNLGTGDDVMTGPAVNGVPSGDGGPGGGGSGGGIVLLAKGNVAVTGTLSVAGGAGGTSGDPDRVGGAGGIGRIYLGAAPPSTVSTVGATTTPGALNSGIWNPTVDLASVGMSQWFDLGAPTAQFQTPFSTTNFAVLPGLQGVDWDAVLEFQGADSIASPEIGTGLTQWSPVVTDVNFKRLVRYRWRFFVSSAYPGYQFQGAPPGTGKPMPAVLDTTIPFTR
jgi:hypothetical protein